MEIGTRYKLMGLVAVGSVFIGLRIGLDRHWSAGIFLFVIPVGIALLFVRAQKKGNQKVVRPTGRDRRKTR